MHFNSFVHILWLPDDHGSFSMVIITFFIAGGFLGLLVTVSFPELVAVVEKMPEV